MNFNLNCLSKMIRSTKAECDRKIDQMIYNYFKLNKEDTYYFYCCRGSGYYLKFAGEINREYLIFDVYTKGGKPKNKQFSLHWCYANYLKKV